MPRIRTAQATQASSPATTAEFTHTLQHLQTRLTRSAQIRENARYHGCAYNTAPAASPLREAHTALAEQLRRRRAYFQQSQGRTSERIAPAMLRGAPTVWCACDDHADASQPAAPGLMSAPGHEHGFLAVDLDEAVHGVYAATKQSLNAKTGSSEAKSDSFLKDQAIDVLPAGTADAALGLTAGALMLPLAGLAIKGGIRECKQAKTMTARLRTEKQRLRQQQADMKRLFGASAAAGTSAVASATISAPAHTAASASISALPNTSTLADPLSSAVEIGVGVGVGLATAPASTPSANDATVLAQQSDAVRIKGLIHGLRSEKNTWAIGASSAASGSTIGTKAAADIGMSTGFGIQSALSGQGFAQAAQSVASGTGAAGVGVAGVFALASTWVIAPLAGAFATALGAFMLHKTRTHRARIKTAFAASQTDLQGSLARARRTGAEPLQFARYVSFIETQGKERLDFLRKFKHWNTAFVAGSGLYAASAVAKAVIIGLSAAGIAAAASNPVGAGILLGVGLAGALAMAIGSIAFFTGHDKQNRYARSAYLDHHLVDRQLLSLDMMDRSSQGDDTQLQQALAPKLLEHLDKRRNAVSNLLEQCAQATGKLARHDPQRSLWKRLQGLTLKGKDIAQWLSTDAGSAAFRNCIKADLQAHCDYLRHRLDTRLQLTEDQLSQLQTLTQTADANDAESELLDAMTRLFSAHDAKLEADQMELETARQLLQYLDGDPEPALDDALCARIGEHLMPGHGIAGIKSLASHLNGEVTEDIQAACDCLFDAQLDSTRLKKAYGADSAVSLNRTGASAPTDPASVT